MEFISGKTLYKILKEEGVQQEKRVINYFVQIAEALKVIHANNLLHRDIKPDNILVDNNNKAVLIDFGATKEFIAGQTSEMSKTLTRRYAPLEQYSYRGKRFPSTDIYALCASMYELLTETLPPDATDIVSGSLGKCGNWQQAELIVNKALKLDSNCTFALGLQAWIAVNQQKWKLSIRTATQAIFTSKQTSCENAQQLKYWVYPHLIFSLDKAATIKQGKDIERRIQEFIDLVPNNSFAWGFRGWKQGLKNLWTDAIFSFEQASCKSQSLQWVLINKGITQEHLHNFQAAIQTYELYIQQFMPSAFVLFRLGTLHGQIEQWKKAQSYLERAVKQEPNYAEAYHNLGWVLLKIKDQNGNLVNFRKILSVYSKASELYSQQKQQTLEFNIKQAFQSVGINSF